MAVSSVIQETRIASGGRRVHLVPRDGDPRPLPRGARKAGHLPRHDAAGAVQGSHLTFGPGLTRTARDRAPRRFVGGGVRASQGRARQNHAWLAGAMRRTDLAVRRGTSLQECDRTAGDSSPVTMRTVGSGDARGRPAGQVPAQGWVKRLRRPRPSSTMPGKPPSPSADNCIRIASTYCQRSRPFVRPWCAGAPTGARQVARTRCTPARRASGATPRRRSQAPAQP